MRKTVVNNLICLFILFNINLFSQGTWEIAESPTNQSLRSLCFVDSLSGWAVGDTGTIIHTSDGGNNWIVQNSNTENKIVNVFFLNRNLGWASSWNTSVVPFGTVMLKTTNGGEDWTSTPYRESDLFMNCILFLDSLKGWMGGSPHALVKTTNGGISWLHADIDSATFAFFPVLDIIFFNSKYGYACGGAYENAGVLWRTSDGGDKWYVIEPDNVPPDPIQELYAFDSLNVIGVGGDFEITGVGVIKTTDGGLFWDYKPVSIGGVATDMDFRNKQEAWASISSLKSFMVTYDSGKTWTQVVTPDSSEIFDIAFPDSLHGFAVGRNGKILRYKPQTINFVKSLNEINPQSFSLEQNYPNPFNPTTKIKYTILSVGTSFMKFVKLKVYDILGNEIATLVNEEQPAGSYEVEFTSHSGEARNLPSGVYFYRLQAGNYSKTMKMLLLR